MPEMTIRMIPDPQTGKKNIIISLTGDEDALPHEHEQMHRAIVDKLLGKAKIKAEEIGQITIAREEDRKVPESPTANPPQDQRKAEQQGR
jgi:hypothetical protein